MQIFAEENLAIIYISLNLYVNCQKDANSQHIVH